MRSKIAQKIIDETPPKVKEMVRRMSDELVRRHKEIEAIYLSEEEMKAIIWSAKVGKWNEQRNRKYWEDQEKKSSRNVVNVEGK